MSRPTDNDASPSAAALAGEEGGSSASGVETGRRTQALPVPNLLTHVASPTAAEDDLARVPLPDACEVALEVTGGADLGRAFPVQRSRILLGRGDVDVALSDRKVSRRHASLEVYGASCVLLKDLGSTNGTFVNGSRVPSAELQDGDTIRLGETSLQVSIGQAPVANRRR